MRKGDWLAGGAVSALIIAMLALGVRSVTATAKTDVTGPVTYRTTVLLGERPWVFETRQVPQHEAPSFGYTTLTLADGRQVVVRGPLVAEMVYGSESTVSAR